MGLTGSSLRRLSALPILVGLLAASSGTQLRTQEAELQYEVAVTLKLIQVYVLDREGQPVTDLNVSDFKVFDNGRSQELTEFETHRLPVMPIEGEKIPREEPADPVQKEAPRLSRKFFFLFDLARMKVDGLNDSKKAALDFLATQVRPTDEVGILVFSPLRGIALHEYLSTDHVRVREIISSFNEMIGSGTIDPFQRRSGGLGDLTLNGERAPGGAEMGADAGIQAQGYTALPASIRTERNPEQDAREIRDFDFIEEMEELAKALGTIPGYKNVVLFSEGFPRQLYQGDTFIQKNINEMAKEFATASSPIHTVNTDGTGHFYKTAEERGDSMLRNLSRLSGGRYLGDVKRFENLNHELHTMTGNYYVLGYYTDEIPDGKYHELKVEVSRKGCRVIAQPGYLNPKPFRKLSNFEKQLRLFDLAMSDAPQFQEPLRFPAVALPFAEANEPNVVLLSRIDRVDLKEILEGKIELVTLIYEGHNLILDTQRRELDADAPGLSEFTTFSVSALPPGTYQCRVALRNLESGRGAVASARVEIPEAQDARMRLHPPLLFISGQDSPVVAVGAGKDNFEGRAPSLDQIYPHLSEKHTVLVQALPPRLRKVMAVLKLDASGAEVKAADFTAALERSGSPDEVPLGVSVLETSEGETGHTVLVELELPELEAGEYLLTITAQETSGGEAATATRALTIK